MSGLDIFSAVVAVGQIANYLRQILRAVEEVKHIDAAAGLLLEKSKGYKDVLETVKPIASMLDDRRITASHQQDDIEKASSQIIIRSIQNFKASLEKFARYLRLIGDRASSASFVEKAKVKRLLDKREGQDLMSAIEVNIQQIMMGITFYNLSESVTKSQQPSNAGSTQSTLHIHFGQELPTSLNAAFGKYLEPRSSAPRQPEASSSRQQARTPSFPLSDSSSLRAEAATPLPSDTAPLERTDTPTATDSSYDDSNSDDEDVRSVVGQLLQEEKQENRLDLVRLRELTDASLTSLEPHEFFDRTPLEVLPALVERHRVEAQNLQAEDQLEDAELRLVEAIRLSKELEAYDKVLADIDELWNEFADVLRQQGKSKEQRAAYYRQHSVVDVARAQVAEMLEHPPPLGPPKSSEARRQLMIAKTYYDSHQKQGRSSVPSSDLLIAESLCHYSFKGFLQIGPGDGGFLDTVGLLIQIHHAADRPLYADVYSKQYPRALRPRRSTTGSTAISPTASSAPNCGPPRSPPHELPSLSGDLAGFAPLTIEPTHSDAASARAMSDSSGSASDGSGRDLLESQRVFLDAYTNNELWPELRVSLTPRGYAHWNYVLVRAVEGNLVSVVERLLDHEQTGIPLSPNVKDAQGRTILHIAARMGKSDMMNAILDHGPDITKSDDHGWTALHYIAANGRVDLARILLHAYKHAEFGVKDNAGNTALHQAVKSKHLDMVQCFLDHPLCRQYEELRNGMNRTALEEAIAMDEMDVARIWRGRPTVMSVDWSKFEDKTYYRKELLPKSPLVKKEKKGWFGRK